MIEAMREGSITASIVELLAVRPEVSHREQMVPGHKGTDLLVSIFSSRQSTGVGADYFPTHGGGIITGDRFTGIEVVLDWVERFGSVCVSVEYGLAPKFGNPHPGEDCHAALVWTAEHASELGIDRNRLIIVGGRSGGGLAAGTALLGRNRRRPALAGQVLMYPSLDKRNDTVSAQQIDAIDVWDRTRKLDELERLAR